MVRRMNFILPLALCFLVGAYAVLVAGILAAVSWGESLGPSTIYSNLVFTLVFFGFGFLPLSAASLGYFAWKRSKIPRYVRLICGASVVISLGLGSYSLLVDFGDFFWSGLPLLVYASLLRISIHTYPEGSTDNALS